MTVSSASQLKGLYNSVKALGNKAVSSDAMIEIEGYEELAVLFKQFVWPVLSVAGEIEIPTPMGGAMWQPQQLKVNQQGAVTIAETVDGKAAQFLKDIVNQGGTFNATCYEGTPENYSRKMEIYGCMLQIDNPDRDHENRAQTLQYTGTMFFHYFGDDE